MWRTPWPWSVIVLAAALILVARRLSDVQVRLERARVLSHAAWIKASVVPDSEDGHPAWYVGRAPSEMAAEWEQAVPPTDS
ncbi:MAG TPA: hypothetical protein VME22_11360 [Solirubrobacteraceae bacterium]|nr:hypothetical protein [Solirubrobacteraceae bacterium]